MKKIKKTKVKPGLLLSVSAMSALAVTAIFSPIAAQAAIDDKKDGIVSLAKAESKKQKKEDDDEDKKDKKEKRGSDLTQEQEALYIQKAKDALQAKNIELPTSGYKLHTFGSKKTNTVYVLWISEAEKGPEKAYRVIFENADLEKGTGTVKEARVINELGHVFRDLEEKLAAPFIEKAKDALKAQNLQLPETGYEVDAGTMTSDDVLRFVEVSFYPEGTKGASGKIFTVIFEEVDLDKGTGKVKDAYVHDHEHEEEEADNSEKKSKSSDDKKGSKKNDKLKKNDKNEKEIDPNQPQQGSSSIGTEPLKAEQAAPFIESAKNAFKAKNIELPENGYEVNSASESIDGVVKNVQVVWSITGTNGDPTKGKRYVVTFTDVDLAKGTGTVQDASVVEAIQP